MNESHRMVAVSVNASGATTGQYLYAHLSVPIALTPGHPYFIYTQETSGGDQWYDQDATLATTSDLTMNSSSWSDGTYFYLGTSGNHTFGPVNLQYGPNQPASTAQSLGTLRNNYSGWVGFKFTTASGTPTREMDWTLDPTGNWSSFTTKTNGTTDLNQTRTANKVNEITGITSTPSWVTPAYDAAGNMTTMPQPSAPSSSFNAVYDAWNRPVSVSASGTTVAQYKYDGRNRRTVRLAYSVGVLSETRHFYFSNGWRDLEQRAGSSTSADQQHVWGLRFIDELICRDRTSERLYSSQDANFNITSLISTTGSVAQRFEYDPYGSVTARTAAWAPATDGYSWARRFQGAQFDAESGFHAMRYRYFHPLLGTWLSRDPLAYRASINQLAFEEAAPVRGLDPLGLKMVVKTGARDEPKDFLQKILDYLKTLCPCEQFEAAANNEIVSSVAVTPNCPKDYQDCVSRHPKGCALVDAILGAPGTLTVHFLKGDSREFAGGDVYIGAGTIFGTSLFQKPDGSWDWAPLPIDAFLFGHELIHAYYGDDPATGGPPASEVIQVPGQGGAVAGLTSKALFPAYEYQTVGSPLYDPNNPGLRRKGKNVITENDLRRETPNTPIRGCYCNREGYAGRR